MQSYSFYLYKDDGGLLGSATVDLASDAAARDYVREVFHSYPRCEELEIWITPRYVGQGRRRSDDSLAPAVKAGSRPSKLRWNWTAAA